MPHNEDYFTTSSVFHNLSFDKVFPVHPNVDMQYRLQKVIRGYIAYRCLYIAACVRRGMSHPLVNKRSTIGFVGCGAFASGILEGLLQTGVDPDSIIISSRRPEIYAKYRRLGVQCIEDNGFVFRKSRVVFLACLPAQLRTALNGLRGQLKKTTLVVSILAGVRILTIKNMLGAAEEQFLRVSFAADAMHHTITQLAAQHKEVGRQEQAALMEERERQQELHDRKHSRHHHHHPRHGSGGGGASSKRSSDSKHKSEREHDLAVDAFYRHDAKSNVCKELVAWALTKERTGPHDGFYAIGSAIQFLLTRLGCGSVARRVAVESTVGARMETPLQRKILIEQEELTYQEKTYEENEPLKRKERVAAQKAIRLRRKEIARLHELHHEDTQRHLAHCLATYDLEETLNPPTGDGTSGSAAALAAAAAAAAVSCPPDIGAEATTETGGAAAVAAAAVAGGTAREVRDGVDKANGGGDSSGDNANVNAGGSEPADGAVAAPAADAEEVAEEGSEKRRDLSALIRDCFEYTCQHYQPQRVVTYMDVLPPDEEFAHDRYNSSFEEEEDGSGDSDTGSFSGVSGGEGGSGGR